MAQNPMGVVKFGGSLVMALVRRPRLVPTALRQAGSLAPQRWWATKPRLPVPPAAYMKFRQTTLSGDPDALPQVHDVIVWLEWCRSMRALPDRN